MVKCLMSMLLNSTMKVASIVTMFCYRKMSDYYEATTYNALSFILCGTILCPLAYHHSRTCRNKTTNVASTLLTYAHAMTCYK